MKLYHSFIILCCITVIASPVFSLDYSGTWKATVTDSSSYCDKIGKDIVGEYTIHVFQKGTEISIVGERGIKWTGVVSGASGNHAHVRATFNDDGGYVTELVDIDFDTATKGKGGSIWTWSDGIFQCGGSFKFKLEKEFGEGRPRA